MHAVVPKDTLWKDSESGGTLKVLKVYFKDSTFDWTYQDDPIKGYLIIKKLNEHWSMEGIEHGEHVPTFEESSPHGAHIRVHFKSKETCHPMLSPMVY